MKTLYDEFRLCVTTAQMGGRKGVGLSPYPYAVGVTSFACERNITTVFAPSYHVAAGQHITSRLRDISLLSERIYNNNWITNKTLKVQSLHSESRPRKERGSRNSPTVITAVSAISFGTVSSKKMSLSSKVSMNSRSSFDASGTISTSSHELSTPESSAPLTSPKRKRRWKSYGNR